MPYGKVWGGRPYEAASKASHGHIINDPKVVEYLKKCDIPKRADQVQLDKHLVIPFSPISKNPIQHIIAVDSGFTEVPVQTRFPSSKICFFQFGALTFATEDLAALECHPFIDPEDISRLNQIERLQLILPLRNVQVRTESSLTSSIRRTVYEFFLNKLENQEILETLRWLLYQEYGAGKPFWKLANCPICGHSNVVLEHEKITDEYLVPCSECHELLYLTDVFRLHEAIDNELGASGIVGYVTNAFEQIVIAHIIHRILELKPALLNEIFFIRDGPLAFFGQTANMHKPMRELIAHLTMKYDLFMVGLEKSGPFVEHAKEIFEKLKPSTALILDNEYIYKYILPGRADNDRPYGSTTYYSNKVIFKTTTGSMHVLSVPTVLEGMSNPEVTDIPNLETILTNVELLRCDMYDNALIPVALANKLVSLSAHPSSRVLQKFAKEAIRTKQ